MGFFASRFIFDGIPSETYNLSISTTSTGSSFDATGSSNVEILTQKIYRKAKPLFIGTQQNSVFEFDVSVYSEEDITTYDQEVIMKWLFGHSEYKKLQIVQPDMEHIYFNCFLTNPIVHKIGNLARGFKCHVICDSPFAWEFPKTLTYNYTDPVVSENIFYNNISDDNAYMYPYVEFTMNSSGGSLSITNANDNNRVFEFSDNLSANEVITIDNDKNILLSSTGLLRLQYFNKKWLRFVQGVNNLELQGNISQIKFTTQNARKVGG